MSEKPARGERGRQAVVRLLLVLPLTLAGDLLLEGGRARAADTATAAVSATVISKSNCKFAANAAALNFGTLDPANPVDVTRTATLTVNCKGSAPNATYLITDDDGLWESGLGAQRMRHAVAFTEYLPYSFSYAPASATILKNTDQTITITGTVTGADYQSALVGTFADTITLTVVP